MYLHRTSSSLAERCCLHNIILISHDKCATMKLNIHHYPGALSPCVWRSSVNYWHRLSADNTSWGIAVLFHRNPIAEKKFTVDVPRGRGTSGSMAPELGWDSAFQSRDSLTGSNLSRAGCRGRQPRLPSSIAVPKWEGRGAGNDDESSHESPGPASRVS